MFGGGRFGDGGWYVFHLRLSPNFWKFKWFKGEPSENTCYNNIIILCWYIMGFVLSSRWCCYCCCCCCGGGGGVGGGVSGIGIARTCRRHRDTHTHAHARTRAHARTPFCMILSKCLVIFGPIRCIRMIFVYVCANVQWILFETNHLWYNGQVEIFHYLEISPPVITTSLRCPL